LVLNGPGAIAYEYGTNGSLRSPAVEAVTTMLPDRCRFVDAPDPKDANGKRAL
jgi:hypothetical protein